MAPDLVHALAYLDDAIRSGTDDDRYGPDAWEAVETLGNVCRDYANILWRQLAPPFGPQSRHQARRILEVLAGRAR